METALHCKHPLSAQFAENKVALVADGGGNREAGYGSVWDDYLVFNDVGESPKSASEHNADCRDIAGELFFDVIGRYADSFHSWIHSLDVIVMRFSSALFVPGRVSLSRLQFLCVS